MDNNIIKEEYKTPPVPSGFRHIKGEWDKGFVIRGCREEKRMIDEYFVDESEFVWIPVCTLKANGTLNGTDHDSRFGARETLRFSGSPSKNIPAELQAQIESVEKYGGFYLSRYPGSPDEDGSIAFVKDAIPETGMCKVNAVKEVRFYNAGPAAKAHLPFAAEMDSALEWLLETGQITMDDIDTAIALRNGRRNTRHSVYYTGVQEDEKNGLFDMLSNIDEWTQEQYDEAFLAGCGLGCSYPTTSRCYNRPYPCYRFCGFRAALYIE